MMTVVDFSADAPATETRTSCAVRARTLADTRRLSVALGREREKPIVGGERLFFASRRRHTGFKCDWSSDVCSSDLHTPLHHLHTPLHTSTPHYTTSTPHYNTSTQLHTPLHHL